MREAETGWGALMISMSKRAPKGSMWETTICWLAGGPVAGRNCANCVRPKAVRMLAMLYDVNKYLNNRKHDTTYFVSWLKSKYKVWLRGNDTVLLSRVI